MNIPFGMWRSHTRKFSPEWFLAVHASIPFISLLRKGVVMPKWAFVLTVAAAVAGQKIGAQLEQQRLGSGQAPGGSSLPDTGLLLVAGVLRQSCMQSAPVWPGLRWVHVHGMDSWTRVVWVWHEVKAGSKALYLHHESSGSVLHVTTGHVELAIRTELGAAVVPGL